MALDRISWHPGFASAMQLELGAYKGSLVFETEHELNRQPLRIDLLVVKKDPDLQIDNEVASIFRGHNVMEFKSEQDSLTIDDLYKTLAYGCLYKAYGSGINAIRADDVTVTLVRRRKPGRMFADLTDLGYGVTAGESGVYDVDGLLFPVRVLVTSELDGDNHVWLTSLASDLETMQVKKLVEAITTVHDKGGRELADSVLNVVTLANTDVVERLKEEDDMGKTLYEIMKPEIDEAIAKARMEAATEAAAEAAAVGMERGMARGMEKGMARGMEKGIREGRMEAVRATVRRLLGRGGYSEEEIADIAGTDVAEVRSIMASMQTVVA